LPHHARGDEFRVVVTGKGGVGKTTLTAMLARRMSRRGYRVLALDADPQMNLPYALGLEPAEARDLTPLSENMDYVEEKTGVRPGEGWGLFFRLNPDVDDVVDRFGVRGPDGVRLLVMGNTVQPAAGCLCPENALLASVANAMSLRHDEAILMDTQAGFEHFGRALAQGFRHAVVVSDPTFNGLQVALRAARLARELGIESIHLVVNRARNKLDFDRSLARRSIAAQGGAFDWSAVRAATNALRSADRGLARYPAANRGAGKRMRVLILGAGPAGLTAARTLRELAPSKSLDPSITIVSAEPLTILPVTRSRPSIPSSGRCCCRTDATWTTTG
jgi:CO dehydrogenase nickel-insertion accessory protein CooC1